MELGKLLSEELISDLKNHASRLWTFQYCFSLFLFCIENEIYRDTKSEIHCFGEILKEYLAETKKKYNNIENHLEF